MVRAVRMRKEGNFRSGAVCDLWNLSGCTAEILRISHEREILCVSPEYIKSSSRSHIAASSIKLICVAKYIFPKMLSWPDFRCVPKALLKYYDPISLLVDTVSIIYKIINDFTLFNFITLKSCQSTQ